mmetsp:Transcript_9796/g.8361  ORF Transcript_9796/g.8361 Transcript_9796/m.8361 type:complete len:120 (+) Transcript_9796:421-780(+)
MMAGFVSCILTIPAEHTRIRMQTQPIDSPLYSGSLDCMGKIIKNHGFKGLYKGGASTITRESLGFGAYFGMYAFMTKALLKPGQRREDLGMLQASISGSIAGVAYWALCYPVDVVKTKI